MRIKNTFRSLCRPAGFVFLGLLACCTACNKPDGAQQQTKTEEATSIALTSSTQPTTGTLPGEIVFNLKYKGWGEKEKERIHSYYGSSTQEKAPNPFTQSLNLTTASLVVYTSLPFGYTTAGKQEHAAAECGSDGQALAVYVDLNRNGTLDAGERILPGGKGNMGNNSLFFLTPDFEVTTDGKKSMSRMLITTQPSDTGNGRKTCSLMWSSACSMEGTGVINGQEQQVFFYENNPGNGKFSQMGSSQYSLVKPEELSRNGNYLSRQTLSRLISIDGQWYETRFSDDGQKFILAPSVVAMGSLCMTLNLPSDLKTQGLSISLVGKEDRTVNFYFSLGKEGKPLDLPALPYELSSGSFMYWPGTEEDPYRKEETRKKCWNASFQEANPLSIEPNQVVYAEFGNPEISIRSEKQENRFRSDGTTQTLFQQGDSLVLTCLVNGRMGERYRRFSRDSGGGQVYPEYTITDTSGSLVTSGTARSYAQKGGTGEFSWQTNGVAPGKYTVTMSQETGPLAGKLEGKLEIEIQEKPTEMKAAVSTIWGK
jgi:hypothetical protein